MAISEEAWQIISILEKEGFGALAGEILTELNLGLEVEKDAFIDEGSATADEEKILLRVPIDESEQLGVAMNILRARLVEPARAFVEAEKIANELTEGGNVRINFIDPEQRTPLPPFSTRDAGDLTVVDEFDDLLARLPRMIVPPLGDGE